MQAYRLPSAALRRSGLTFSVTMASRLGRAPPRPRPVAKRAHSSRSALGAWAVAAEKAANRATETTVTHLRPARSEALPPITAPTIRPKVLIEANRALELTKPPTKPWPVVRWNSGARTGMVTPGVCRSKPSPNAAMQQKATIRIARLGFGAWAADAIVPPGM